MCNLASSPSLLRSEGPGAALCRKSTRETAPFIARSTQSFSCLGLAQVALTSLQRPRPPSPRTGQTRDGGPSIADKVRSHKPET
mmetsp:Transcript_42648/g.99399  ORF Transcript_42648/g.99399 Transcript_42648/m.99399 type:complete len:84 (-) Transcript_42648:1360-1611(-)